MKTPENETQTEFEPCKVDPDLWSIEQLREFPEFDQFRIELTPGGYTIHYEQGTEPTVEEQPEPVKALFVAGLAPVAYTLYPAASVALAIAQAEDTVTESNHKTSTPVSVRVVEAGYCYRDEYGIDLKSWDKIIAHSSGSIIATCLAQEAFDSGDPKQLILLASCSFSMIEAFSYPASKDGSMRDFIKLMLAHRCDKLIPGNPEFEKIIDDLFRNCYTGYPVKVLGAMWFEAQKSLKELSDKIPMLAVTFGGDQLVPAFLSESLGSNVSHIHYENSGHFINGIHTDFVNILAEGIKANLSRNQYHNRKGAGTQFLRDQYRSKTESCDKIA